MELLGIILVTTWAKVSAIILVREAQDAETKFWRAAIAGALLGLWAFACIDIIPSPLNRLGVFFPSDEILRWTCGVAGVIAAAGLWGAGRFLRVGKESALHLLPAALLLSPFVYRFVTAPRANWPIERLARVTQEGSARDAQRAVHVLGGMGEPAIAPLLAALRDPGLRIQAMGALVRIGEPAIKPLQKLLAANPTLSAAAAESLGKIGPAARVAVADLAQLVDGQEAGPRLAAIDALGRIGPSALFGIPALERAAQTEPRAQAALRKVATAEAIRALRESQRRAE
ncbi:MAG: hypothetical protein COB53_03530 [Elusimicrobia bacterium]|nr:MAG: hypothetical protein COB53_03530 [Elusimicrobiota bacterium]